MGLVEPRHIIYNDCSENGFSLLTQTVMIPILLLQRSTYTDSTGMDSVKKQQHNNCLFLHNPINCCWKRTMTVMTIEIIIQMLPKPVMTTSIPTAMGGQHTNMWLQPAAADSFILGENANDLGHTLSHAGDLDGDGTPDFALGARTHGAGGAVYIFDGLPGSNVSASTADAKLTEPPLKYLDRMSRWTCTASSTSMETSTVMETTTSSSVHFRRRQWKRCWCCLCIHGPLRVT